MVAEGIDPELQPLARVDAEPVHHIHGIGHGVSSVLIECHLPCQLTGVEDYSRPFDRCQKPRCWPSPGCGPLPCGGPSLRRLRLLSESFFLSACSCHLSSSSKQSKIVDCCHTWIG